MSRSASELLAAVVAEVERRREIARGPAAGTHWTRDEAKAIGEELDDLRLFLDDLASGRREVSEGELRLAAQVGRTRRARGADYLWIEVLEDGRAVSLIPWSGSGFQLAIGALGSGFHVDTWLYRGDMHDAAWRAALTWKGEGEPEGWWRHPYTGRRREDGTPASEIIQR